MSDEKLTGISAQARCLLGYVGDYHKATQTAPLSLEECRLLFSRLNNIKDAARALSASTVEGYYSRERNPVVNSIVLHARGLCTGKFDAVEFVQRLEKVSLIFVDNERWDDFIKNDAHVIPANVTISNEGCGRPESQDPRYWGDSRRAQACVEELLENVQEYHATRTRFRQLREEDYDSECGMAYYVLDENRALAEHAKEVKQNIALLYKYAARYEGIKDKNYVVDGIIRYVFKAQSEGIDVSDMIEEMKNAAFEYNRHGAAYFNFSGMESTFPRIPTPGVYVRINYPHSVRVKDRAAHSEKMQAVYKDMIAENSDLPGGSADSSGFFLRVENEKKAREIAVADKYCQTFFIFEAKYLKFKLVSEILGELEKQQKEEFVGTVTPFSRLEPGTELYKDFVDCGAKVTHVVHAQYASREMFFGPNDQGMVHDSTGKVLWPVSAEELKSEAEAVAAARQALRAPSLQLDKI